MKVAIGVGAAALVGLLLAAEPVTHVASALGAHGVNYATYRWELHRWR